MWMAAGFTMLEAGLVRAKNVSEIVTKNLGLYSIACVMYLVCGFFLMYPGDSVYNAYFPMLGSTWGMSLKTFPMCYLALGNMRCKRYRLDTSKRSHIPST